ncbi:MAG TPA: hypothetical protein PLP05_12010, partial [Sedimentisphaerales bacterium]|nr:hypothetical protein [Sedimentisphaerales bacterium]
MKKVKQGLSLILAAAILISSTGIGLGTKKLNAEVPAAKSLSKSTPSFAITFYVPEVIYLTPSLGTTSSFQYFVDCDTSGNLNNSRNKTTGTVYFNCASASATNVSISVSGGSISSWSITTQNTNTFNGTINSGSVTTAQAQGVESYLTWTATYYINGEAKTATAYTCVYAPYCKPVGAAAGFNNSYGADNYAQAVSWISGVYGYSTATRGGNYDPRTASNSLYSLGASVTPPVAGNHTPVSSWLTAVSGGSIGYQSKDASDDGTLYSNSPHGLLTVDTSRYSNMNQIPNFTAGFMVTDDESNESCTSYWVDFTDRSHNDNGFDGDNNNVWTERDDRPSTNIDGTAAPSTQRQENIRYNGTWSRAISSTGNQELRFKGLLLAEQNGDEAQVSTCTYLTLTKTDKSALRSAVRQYTNYGLQTADYTSGSWSTFSAELVNAYQRLVNPKYSADVSTTNLVNAYNALSRNTYSANIYHRSADGYVYQDESLTFYSSET